MHKSRPTTPHCGQRERYRFMTSAQRERERMLLCSLHTAMSCVGEKEAKGQNGVAIQGRGQNQQGFYHFPKQNQISIEINMGNSTLGDHSRQTVGQTQKGTIY